MHTLLQYCQPQNDVMVESLKRMTTPLQARHHTRKQSGSPNELKDMVGECVMRAITGFLIVQHVSQHKVLYICSMRQMAPPPPSRPPLRNFDRARTYKEYRERERERSRRSWKTNETWSHVAKTVLNSLQRELDEARHDTILKKINLIKHLYHIDRK